MADFAILAPVPLEHLRSAEAVSSTQPFVAFGTNKWEFLRSVDADRAGERVPMLLYASHEGVDADPSYVVSWIGWYVGSSEPRRGKHLDPLKRPKSTETDGPWAAFWHVEDLQEVPKAKQKSIGKLATVKAGWRKDAPPRGPERVTPDAELMAAPPTS